MSRKIKYDVDFKLRVVHQIIIGKESVDSMSIKFNIAASQLERWGHFYRLHGMDRLLLSNRYYSPEFKLEVVLEVKSKSLSLNEASRQRSG
jgi:transposase